MSEIPADLTAALAGQYDLEREIGAGGMATVYLATDPRHRRQVAVKVLKPEIAMSVGGDRFLQEIRTTANLRHPHIVPLFDSGETDGFLWYVMPFIEGESLRKRLDRDVQLSIDESLRLAGEVAGALAYAHERGVVHRDIKPDNIMLESGHAVVTDFGIASAVSLAGGERLTQTGMIVGTPAYMSPEQASGQGEPDQRSDLYSLACVTYEMLAGQPPFTAPTAAVVLARHMFDPVPPLTTARPGIPDHIAEAVERAMAKTPVDRFDCTDTWVAALASPPHSPIARSEPGPGPATAAPAGHPSAGLEHAEPTAAPPASTRRRPLVGRVGEVETLTGHLDGLGASRGGLVLIGGEPGVGKTRLTNEIVAIAREREMFAFEGHCYEGGGAEPFIPFMEILDEAARMVPRDRLRRAVDGRASEVLRLQPELHRLFPELPTPPELPPEQLRRYLSNGMLEFLRGLGREAPIVLFIDDLQWADEATMHLIQHLAPHLETIPVLILATHRNAEADLDEPFRRGRANLVRQKQADRITLTALGQDAISELLASLGAPEPPAEVVGAIYEATDGNPFFVEEVFEHLSEEGRLLVDGVWQTGIGVEDLDVPEGVRVVIGRRLDRLGDTVTNLLGEAAVIGRRFDLDVLENLSELDGDAFLDAIEEAEGAGLIEEERAGRETRYSFTHDLIRQTLESGLSLVRRRRIHARVAGAMEEVYGRRVVEHAAAMARHLAAAGSAAEPEKTLRMHRLAGLEALETAAGEEAEAYFDVALEILEDMGAGAPGGDDDRGHLLYHRGMARRMLGKWPHAEADLMEALPVLEAAREAEMVARLCREIAFFEIWSGRPEKTVETCERGLAAVGEEPSSARCRVLSMMAWAHAMKTDFEDAEKISQEAIAMAEALGDEQVLASAALLTRMYYLEMSSQPREWWEVGERTIDIMRRVGSPFDLAEALGIALLALPVLGRFDEAESMALEAEALAEQEGNVGSLIHVFATRLVTRAAAGDVSAGFAAIEACVSLCEANDLPWGPLMCGWAAVLELRRGRFDVATNYMSRCPHEGLPPSHAGIARAARLVTLAHTDPEAASTALESALDEVPEPVAAASWGSKDVAIAVVEAAALMGRDAEAAAVYPVLKQMLRDEGIVRWTYGLTERYAGMSARAAGDFEAASRHFERALEQADTLPHRLEQPEVRLWFARLLRARGGTGDAERADRMSEEAREQFAALGFDRDAEGGSMGPDEGRSASIAVLPFVSMSQDPDDEFLADGIAEDIMNALAGIPDLKVAARTSAFSFRGTDKDLRTIGERLGVATVLEGSVRRAGKRLRITAQLVGVEDGYQLWSERYDRELEDVFAVQDEISESIAHRLEVTLGVESTPAAPGALDEAATRPSEPGHRGSRAAAGIGTSNIEAYEAYLKGRYLWYQRTPMSMAAACDCFERAIELDPDFASAYAGLSDSYSVRRAGGYVSHHETVERVSHAARRALDLAPETAETQVTAAYFESYYGEHWPSAEPHWLKAIEYDSDLSVAHVQYSLFLSCHRRREEAHRHSAIAREVDPLSPFVAMLEGMGRWAMGDYEDAVESYRASTELQVDFPLANLFGGISLSCLGRHDEGIRQIERAVEMTRRIPLAIGMLGYAHALAGDRGRIQELLAELEERATRGYVSPIGALLLQMGLGDLDGIAGAFGAAVEDHMPPVTLSLLPPDHVEELGRDSGFAELFARLRMPGYVEADE